MKRNRTLADLITKPILTNHRCPKCNSRIRHLGNRLYRCGHCKVLYKLVMESIKIGIVNYGLKRTKKYRSKPKKV